MREIRVLQHTTLHALFDREGDLSITVEAGARFEAVLVALGTADRRVRIRLEGERAEAHLYGLFIVGEGERAAYHAEIEHLVPNCLSRQDFRGVASGNGTGLFEGLIRVAPGAQRTQAFQQSNNLLMSDLATIETRPQLEIYADDVKCSHGATTGQLDPQAVFYLRQRGLNEDQARKLQLQGFFRAIVDRIADSDAREQIDELVTAKLSGL